MQVTLDIPEKYALLHPPEDLAHFLKLNTAIELYRTGRLSASAAADFAGNIQRDEFLRECRKHGVEPQTYENKEELESEIDFLNKVLP